MHPKNNQLRAMIDHELPEKQAGVIQMHVSGCPTCQTKLAAMQARAEQVQESLSFLAPRTFDRTSRTQAAFHHLMEKSRQIDRKKEYYTTMSTRKSLLTAFAIVAILAVVFTMTPARAWASNFLGFFRVQKIAVIEFDQLAAEQSSENISAQEEAVNQLLKKNMTISEGGDTYDVTSVEEAAAAAGFTPRVPGALAGGQFSVQTSMNAELVIDQPQMQALLDAFEIDVQIPPAMDGQTVRVDVPAGVIVSSGCQSEEIKSGKFGNCTVLYQMPSPTVDAPEGLNVDKLGEAMLQLLGYSSQEARTFSKNIDWTSTLLVPIPSGEGIDYQDVSVDGVPGTLFTHEEEAGFMLLWVKKGMLYGLRGPGSLDEALEIGNSLP